MSLNRREQLSRDRAQNSSEKSIVKNQEKLTWRSVIIGLAGVLFLSIVNMKWTMLRERHAFPVQIPLSVLGTTLILVLLFLNAVFKKYSKNNLRFKPSELIVVYSMVIVGGLTVSSSFLFPIIQLPIVLTYSSMTSQAGKWDPLLNAIAKWLIIEDRNVVGGFIAGMSRFRMDAVPWESWIIPLLGWTSFYLVLFIAFLCLGTMVRKRWQEQELVNYPLTYPVVEMVQGQTGQERDEATGRRLFYVGFGIAAFVMVWQQVATHTVLPAIPEVIAFPQIMGDVNPFFYLFYRLSGYHPAVLGITYLVPNDIVFSTWFFFLMGEVGHLLLERYTALASVSGVFHNPVSGAYARSAGGMTVLAVFLLWLARGEIALIFRKALFGSRMDNIDDSDEPLSYRTAAIGFIVTTLFLFMFQIILLRIPFALALLHIIGVYSVSITMARVRAESGILRGSPGISTLDTTVVGARFGLFSYYRGLIFPLTYGGGGTYLPLFLETSRLADKTNLRQRELTKAILLAFVVAFAVGAYVAITVVYSNNIQALCGMENIRVWYESYTEESGMYSGDIYWQAMTVFWGLFTLLLGILRVKFVRWPFTPVGFVIGSMQEIGTMWFGFFTIWLIKLIIFRYAGAKTYMKFIPLAVGLVVGYVVCASVFTIVGLPPVWHLS